MKSAIWITAHQESIFTSVCSSTLKSVVKIFHVFHLSRWSIFRWNGVSEVKRAGTIQRERQQINNIDLFRNILAFSCSTCSCNSDSWLQRHISTDWNITTHNTRFDYNHWFILNYGLTNIHLDLHMGRGIVGLKTSRLSDFEHAWLCHRSLGHHLQDNTFCWSVVREQLHFKVFIFSFLLQGPVDGTAQLSINNENNYFNNGFGIQLCTSCFWIFFPWTAVF